MFNTLLTIDTRVEDLDGFFVGSRSVLISFNPANESNTYAFESSFLDMLT